MPIRSFDNKVAVVTGGASGIGLAIAERLSGLGCQVALVDARADRLPSAGQRIDATGQRVSTHECNIADYDQLLALFNQIVSKHGRVNVLVNSAGVSLAGRFMDASLDDFEWVMRVNFWGTVYCCRAFLPLLLNE